MTTSRLAATTAMVSSDDPQARGKWPEKAPNLVPGWSHRRALSPKLLDFQAIRRWAVLGSNQ
jgi:hypothetical protein